MFVQEPVTPEKLEAIALVNYIEELGRQLNSVDVEKFDEDAFISRSPSPPPEYDKKGVRTNTREHRIRNALNVERTLAVRKALELIPDYTPPSDFHRLARIVEKYPIPVRDFPQINFVGLLLGPRGNALRRMETDSGARISIRGRGSVKEGSRSATAQPAQEEDLHCLVSATSHESIQKAFSLIKQVIDTATQTPEHENDFKRLQLRELAELNGTLRDYENQLCTFCGEPGHRKFACPQREAALRDAVCRRCGQPGHIMRDCGSAEPKKADAMGSEPLGLQEFFNDLEDDPTPGTAAAVAVADRSGQGQEDLSIPSAPHVPGSDSAQVHRPFPLSSGDQSFSPLEPAPLTHEPPTITQSNSAAAPGPPGFVASAVSSDGAGAPSRVLAPPGIAPPGIAPPGIAPPGIAPPGIAPPGIAPLGIAPPGIAPPGIAPPGITPPGVTGSSAPRTQPLKDNELAKPAPPPPSAWKPPTWKPPTTPSAEGAFGALQEKAG